MLSSVLFFVTYEKLFLLVFLIVLIILSTFTSLGLSPTYLDYCDPRFDRSGVSFTFPCGPFVIAFTFPFVFIRYVLCCPWPRYPFLRRASNLINTRYIPVLEIHVCKITTGTIYTDTSVMQLLRTCYLLCHCSMQVFHGVLVLAAEG